jgi:ABC-type proline/glycine betaine transport system permease subunit
MAFTPPWEQWANLPSFMIGELFFISAALLSLWHAQKNGRTHLLAWVGAIIAGTSNDLIFMALPLVDNFWQAQAMIMITPRLPLYIPCVYVCFMYLPTVAVWRLKLPPLSRAALTGLAAIMLYAPYDIIGAKFLWWTWHDTDVPIAVRLLGVPLGSTIWVITFAATFAALVGFTIDRDPKVSNRSFIRGLVLICGLTTLLMMIQMTILQQVDGGAPGLYTLILIVCLYTGLTIGGFKKSKPEPQCKTDRPLLGLMGAHFSLFLLILLAFDPVTHRSNSAHQTVGPCGVEAKDLLGFTRHQFLCVTDFDEDFTFDCVDALPAHGSNFYTVCGKAHTNRGLWITVVGLLGLVGFLLYAYLFGFWRKADAAST